MHIPDNYLSPATCAVMGAVMIPVWVNSVRMIKKEVSKKKLPLLGIGAAFSFLIMMFNVPIPGGTTGHAVGGTLISILLGPYAACISISIALLVQALLFGDGGILAFGANCFNMAFILPFMGFIIYKLVKKLIRKEKGEYVSSFVGSYFGIVLASLCAAIEFGIQPIFFKDAQGMPLYCPYPLSASIPAMLFGHMLIAGVIEAFVTAGVLAFIKKASPDILYEKDTFSKKSLKPMYILLAVMTILTPIGLIASGTAWGEWGADEIAKTAVNGKALGYVPHAFKKGFNFNAIFSDYSVKSLPDVAGYIISAIIGAAILIILFKFISVKVNGKKQQGK